MEPFIFIIIGAVLFVHGWNLIRVVDLRTVGFLAAAAAIGLSALVLLQETERVTDASDSSITALAVLLALYAAVLAAVGLWDFDVRTLGLYAIFLAVAMVGYTVYFFDILATSDTGLISTLGGVVTLVLAIVFALLFVAYVPPLRRTYQTVVGYFFLIGAAVVAIVGVGSLLDIVDLTL